MLRAHWKVVPAEGNPVPRLPEPSSASSDLLILVIQIQSDWLILKRMEDMSFWACLIDYSLLVCWPGGLGRSQTLMIFMAVFKSVLIWALDFTVKHFQVNTCYFFIFVVSCIVLQLF